MKKFAIGAAAGASALALAFPLLVSAAGDASASQNNRPVPSQACVQAIAANESTAIGDIDAMTAARKEAMKTHQTALTAAALITDDTQRMAAIKAANDAFRTALKNARDAKSTTIKTAMDAVKAACGDTMRGMMGGFGGKEGFAGFFKGHKGKGGMMGHGFGHHGFGPDQDTETNDDGQ